MFELKTSKSKKVTIKDLCVESGVIVDAEGNDVDLNKVVKLVYDEGEYFSFSVTAKTDDTEMVEDGESDE